MAVLGHSQVGFLLALTVLGKVFCQATLPVLALMANSVSSAPRM